MNEIGFDIAKLTRELKESEVSFLPKGTYLIKGDDDQAICQLVPYKTARVDMDILDDACGVNWQNEFKRDSKGVLQCGIGIYNADLSDWIWRWSNGVPSKFEADKGEYSDAFKRAGFMWGIGRDLYSYPRLSVTLNKSEYDIITEDKKPKPKVVLKNSFRPNTWKWEISKTEADVIQVIGSQRMQVKGKMQNVIRCNSNPYGSKKPQNN